MKKFPFVTLAIVLSVLSLNALGADCGVYFDAIKVPGTFKSFDDLEDYRGGLSQFRTLSYLEAHNPYKKLKALADKINSRDPEMKKIGSYKKVKEQSWSPKKGNHFVEVEAFHFQDGKETLSVKVPMDGDLMDISFGGYQPSFNFRPEAYMKTVKWKGKNLILLHDELLAYEVATSKDAGDMASWQLDRAAKFHKEAGGKFEGFTKNLRGLSSRLVVTRLPSLAEMKAVNTLLGKLGVPVEQAQQDLKRLELTKENDYRTATLGFSLNHSYPSAETLKKIGANESVKGENVVFGDGDLTARVLSEKPYRLWLKESEDYSYVIEKPSLESKETKIYFNSKPSKTGFTKPKGTATLTSEGEIKIEGDVSSYAIGRLAFPPELIAIRADEAAGE